MIHLINSLAALSGQAEFVVYTAMEMGLFFIVALALNFMYGGVGVPFIGCSVPVMMGGLAVSAVTTRIAYLIVEVSGLELFPWKNDYGWVYNNKQNINLVNGFFRSHPTLCITLLLFSLALSMILGAAAGWAITRPAIRLRSTYLLVALITIPSLFSILDRKIIALSGGTLGLYIPNFLAFYSGERTIPLAALTLLVGLFAYTTIKSVLDSPYGRLMSAVRDNEQTVLSVGGDVTGIKTEVIILGSAVMALSGTLLSFYFNFVIECNFTVSYWTFWALLIVVMGGPWSGAGVLLGTIAVTTIRSGITLYKTQLDELLFFPIAYLMRILLATLVLASLILHSWNTHSGR